MTKQEIRNKIKNDISGRATAKSESHRDSGTSLGPYDYHQSTGGDATGYSKAQDSKIAFSYMDGYRKHVGRQPQHGYPEIRIGNKGVTK